MDFFLNKYFIAHIRENIHLEGKIEEPFNPRHIRGPYLNTMFTCNQFEY